MVIYIFLSLVFTFYYRQDIRLDFIFLFIAPQRDIFQDSHRTFTGFLQGTAGLQRARCVLTLRIQNFTAILQLIYKSNYRIFTDIFEVHANILSSSIRQWFHKVSTDFFQIFNRKITKINLQNINTLLCAIQQENYQAIYRHCTKISQNSVIHRN